MKEVQTEILDQEVPTISQGRKITKIKDNKDGEATVVHRGVNSHKEKTNPDQNPGLSQSSDQRAQGGRGLAVQRGLLLVWRGQSHLKKATQTTTIIDK